MSQFYITCENTEDRFNGADSLQDAIRMAREVVLKGQVGEPINIEFQGKNIRQLVLLPNGTIAEEILTDRGELVEEKRLTG